ncbi:MAG: alanine racemase [Planctomycetota bacterium]
MRLPDLLTPALLIHLDRVRHNLAAMQRWLGGDIGRWRPHVKTCKVPEVMRLLLDIGVQRFKCATTREAEQLLALAEAAGRRIDLLFAMAQHGANLDRVRALAAAHPRQALSVLSEDPAHAERLAAAGLGVFVDLDPGYHRTGIALAARDRIAAAARAAGAQLRGLHCYDGHLHDATPADRRAAAHRVYAELIALADALGMRGELATSGTPTFPDALAFPGFAGRDHTVGPGTVVYWDARSEALGIDGFTCAAEVLARVISHPAPGRFTVDAGSKAVDAAAGTPCVRLQPPWRGTAATPSEEHLPFAAADPQAVPPLGTLVRLVPAHVCPTVNLADDAVLLEGGEIVAIVPVRARGHETAAVAPPPDRQDTGRR